MSASSQPGASPAPTSSPASLDLDGISKRFGAVEALKPFSLSVPPGSLLSLLGPSGCGKTTTLRIIAGFEHPDTGAVRINGADVTRQAPRLRSIGMVFQNYSLFPHLNVHENVAFGLTMRKEPRRLVDQRVGEMLDLVQLPGFESRYPRELSGGQQQRVALARALITRPSILLLDEPLGALDKNLRESMQFELRRIQRQLGITSVLVTHDQEEALTMSDVVAVMHEGRIVQAGAPREIYERPNTRFVSEFLGTSNVFRGIVSGSDDHGVSTVTLEQGDARIRVSGTHPQGASIMVAVRPERIGFADSAVADRNSLPVRITGHVFRGGYHAYETQTVGADQRIFVHCLAADDHRIRQVGDGCFVVWPTTATVTLADGS